MILYTENPKDSTKKKLVEVINEFSKIIGYKLDTQKLVVLSHASNEQSKNEIKKTKTIPFAIGSGRN